MKTEINLMESPERVKLTASQARLLADSDVEVVHTSTGRILWFCEPWKVLADNNSTQNMRWRAERAANMADGSYTPEETWVGPDQVYSISSKGGA